VSEPSPARGSLDIDQLEQLVDEGEIETVVTALPDLYGRLVGKRITGRFFLDEIAGDGMHACDYLFACDMEMDPTPGYAFTSWETGYGDFRGIPDLGTLRRASWLDRSALVLCDAYHEDRDELVEVAPRTLLAQTVERAEGLGLVPWMGSELEFFLFRESYASAREKGYRNLATSQHYIEDYHVLSGSFAEPVIGAIRRHVDSSGIPVEFSKGEWGPGQHEINLRYARALEMADRHTIYKLAAKEIAAQNGCALTFMAKFDHQLAGNSLHIHLSLTDTDGRPVFPGERELLPGKRARASETFRFVLGGMLEHARELALFFAPNSNSYKRYRAGTFAPTRVAYSYDNRTVGFRIVGHGPSLRVECRIPGGDARRRCQPLPGLLGADCIGARRHRAPPRPRADLHRGCLRRRRTARSARDPGRSHRRARPQLLCPRLLRRFRGGAPASLCADRAQGPREHRHRFRTKPFLRAHLAPLLRSYRSDFARLRLAAGASAPLACGGLAGPANLLRQCGWSRALAQALPARCLCHVAPMLGR
jgi:glutamine synthetase